MTMDTEYIKQILEIMENSDSPTVYSMDIMAEISKTGCSENTESKFIKHIWDLRDIGAIESRSYDMGFRQGANGDWVINGTFYRLTVAGQQLLDVMRNDTWWNHIKSMGKEVTKETLRQAPAVIMGKLLSC